MTNFYEVFKPNKITIKTPGRDWSEEGLASWYEEEVYPQIDGELFLELLSLYNNFVEKTNINNLGKLELTGITEQDIVEQFKFHLTKSYNNITNKEKQQEFKDMIKGTIDEYYIDWEEE